MTIKDIAQKFSVMGGIMAFLMTLGGAALWINSYFTPMSIHNALAGDVAEVKKTQKYMGFSFQQRSVEERMNKLEDRYEGKQMPKSVKEEYNKLGKTNDELKSILEDLNKKSIESVK